MKGNLETKKKELYEEYLKHAREKLDQRMSEEEEILNQEFLAADKKSAAAMEELEKLKQSHMDEWVNEICQRVIHGD